MLKVRIEKNYPSFQLDLQLESQSKRLVLLGSSGSGKSLTLKMLAGIINPDQGMIQVDDRVFYDSKKRIQVKPQERRVGYLFQDYALFPNFTVRENIQVGLGKGPASLLDQQVQALKLEEVLDQYPSQLSGGQKQRVALARVLVNQPDLLLLDEPFSALDPHLRYAVETDLTHYLRSLSLPYIVVTHDAGQAYRLGEEICLLEEGQLVEHQSKSDFFQRPKTRAGARILGVHNILPARDWVQILNLDPALLAEWPWLGVPNHGIQVSQPSDPQALMGRIQVLEDNYQTVDLTVVPAQEVALHLSLPPDIGRQVAVGQELAFRLTDYYLLKD
ncbi:sulfate/molybdate ABC transporter ATP-binding protein [Hutsoniella sourekii]|uniref:sulfate/molybdate ABC transporter ATP-binding protein n=1 Tax=Hutsoniella sourekii TaxID=87650 RepID=UPI0004B50F86|nr:ATP-binding cassette domain-containing protein [Hutsoniella sourekii]